MSCGGIVLVVGQGVVQCLWVAYNSFRRCALAATSLVLLLLFWTEVAGLVQDAQTLVRCFKTRQWHLEELNKGIVRVFGGGPTHNALHDPSQGPPLKAPPPCWPHSDSSPAEANTQETGKQWVGTG